MESKPLDRKEAATFVESMDIKKLMTYIEKRLKKIKINPPLSATSDESPEYLLEKIYENSQDDEFKERFRRAIAKLLTYEQIEMSTPDYLASLLIFCEQYIISEALVPIGGMALSEKMKGVSSIDGDLHRRVLMALARIPQGLKMSDIWINAVDDPRYTSAAFAAFSAQGLDKIIKYLHLFIRAYRKYPDSIDLEFAILKLYDDFKDEYTEQEISELIAQSLENEDQEIISTVKEILENWDKTLPTPPGDRRDSTEINKHNWLFQVKNSLCRILTQEDGDTLSVISAIKAWESIAEFEDKSGRGKKWGTLLQDYQQGKLL
jgi:hypothetical protein